MARRKIPFRILVVEDDPDILNALNIALGSIGFDVDVLLNGKSIMQNRFSVPDLFILDYQLPDVSGLDVCQFLKSKVNYRHIPVLIISASPRIRKKAVESGASGFLEKPFEMQALLHAVRDALGLPADQIRSDRNHS